MVQAAYEAFLNHLAHPHPRRRGPELEVHHVGHALRLRRLEHFAGLGLVEGERLFAQHVLSGLDRRHRRGIVQLGRRHHAHEIDVGKLGEGPVVGDGMREAEAVRHLARPTLVVAAHRRHARAGRVLPERKLHPNPKPRPDDSNADFALRHRYASLGRAVL